MLNSYPPFTCMLCYNWGPGEAASKLLDAKDQPYAVERCIFNPVREPADIAKVINRTLRVLL